MKRHLVIGRFGPSDRITVPRAESERVTQVNIVSGKRRLGYGIGDALDDLARFNIYPSELGLDLLILAAHVHAADTRISRHSESQDMWTREIRLVVPVSDLNRWSVCTPLLQRMLNFLTGDRWTIGFRSRPIAFANAVPVKPAQTPAPRFDVLALFSGGLDSFIGAIDSIEQGLVPLFISHAGEPAASSSQDVLFRGLRRNYPNSTFDRLRIWMAFPDGLVRNVPSEKTTRGRSFLFFAAGILAATGFPGRFTLRVPENGLIALNVPLDPLRLGALSTRTTHPFYMARWNELIAALGIEGKIENPYWDKTKGEMIAGCRNRRVLLRLISETLSCASPTKGRWLGHAIEHCGYCLPCLIRRAAILKGLRAADPTSYTLSDLSAHVLDTCKAEGQQVRSFQFAISRLRDRPELAKLLIHKPGPLFDETPTHRVALGEVYRRGLEELAELLADVETAPR